MRDTVYRYNTTLRIALLADLHDREFGSITDSLKAHKPETCALFNIICTTDYAERLASLPSIIVKKMVTVVTVMV